MKLAYAYLLAFGLGFLCRTFGISAPAPNTIVGAGLVLAVTLGYLAAGLKK